MSLRIWKQIWHAPTFTYVPDRPWHPEPFSSAYIQTASFVPANFKMRPSPISSTNLISRSSTSIHRRTHAHTHMHTHTHTLAHSLTHSLTRPKGEKSVWRSSALTAGTSPLTHKLHCGGLQNETGRTILQQSNVSQSNVVLQSCAERPIVAFSGSPTLLNLSYVICLWWSEWSARFFITTDKPYYMVPHRGTSSY